MSVVTQIDRLGKQYRLGQIGSGRLVEDLSQWLGKLRGKGGGAEISVGSDGQRTSTAWRAMPQPGSNPDIIWALKNVSFEIKQGEVLGLVGRNGSGKSTLLKILSRVTAPTEGEVRIKGRVASLLEVGTGFHHELTGRENIFLNGAILGMTKSEIRAKFDEIVEFSEVGQFIDTPVKRYSSGMHVRLAFAVAAHLEPEILIVDEVLAVGDAAFQKKCLGRMQEVAGEGRTVIFVSHSMETVRNLCQRAIWLKAGQLHQDGPAAEVVEAYFNSISREVSLASPDHRHGFVIRRLTLKNGKGEDTNQFRPGEDLIVEISYHASILVDKPYIKVGVVGINGACFTANMLLDGARPRTMDGAGTVVCRFKSVPLLPQNYAVKVGVISANAHDAIIPYQEAAFFSVVGNLADYGYKGDFLDRASHYTPVVVPYEWRLPDGSSTPISLNAPLSHSMIE